MISTLAVQSGAMQAMSAMQMPPPPTSTNSGQDGSGSEGVGAVSGASGTDSNRPPPPPPPSGGQGAENGGGGQAGGPPQGGQTSGADAESVLLSLFEALETADADSTDTETSDAVTDLLSILESAAEDGYSSSLALFAA